MKKTLSLLLAFLLFALMTACSVQVTPGSGGNALQFEGNGFDSPEETARAYMEALQNGDIDGMIRTFAVETYAKNYDMEAFMWRLQSINPSMEYLPAEGEPFDELNILNRVNDIRRQIRWQLLALFGLQDWNGMESGARAFHDENEVARYVEDFSPDLSALKKINVLEVLSPEDAAAELGLDGIYDSEQNQRNIANQMKPYHADDWSHMTVRFDFDGEEYCLLFEMLCYGDKWYVGSFQGNMSLLLGISIGMGGLYF